MAERRSPNEGAFGLDGARRTSRHATEEKSTVAVDRIDVGNLGDAASPVRTSSSVENESDRTIDEGPDVVQTPAGDGGHRQHVESVQAIEG